MRYVAAYLLAVLGGNKAPNAGDIEKILSSVGIEAEKDKLDKVISQLNGKDVKQLVEQGKLKLSSMPAGGAVAVAAPAAGGAAPAGGGGTPAAAKKEEKKEEPKDEESDEDMGFGLFD